MDNRKSYRYRIGGLKLEVGKGFDDIPVLIEKKLCLKRGELSSRVNFAQEMKPGSWLIRRESVDARKKSEIRLTYTIDVELAHKIKKPEQVAKRGKIKISAAAPEQADEVTCGDRPINGRPVIVGFGPCGIFAALELAGKGYRPIVVERGSSMSKRVNDVRLFRDRIGTEGSHAAFNPESNMLFGEGGAGTFSDGKLTSGIKDDRIRFVLETFFKAGADESILYAHKPHIGTDDLRRVIVVLRKEIEELGGEVRFDTRLDELVIEDGRLKSILVTESKRGWEPRRYKIETEALVLSPGHSARDTFEMLKSKGIHMEQKPFSIGVRMEHPQELIDRAQYGDERRLPPADYKLSYKTSNGRGVYSFCMCPGGEVVTCSTRDGELCVNGMSNSRRDSGIANSGILCDVRREDFGSDDVLAGVRFQEKYERLAFINGGGNFRPPTCKMSEFLTYGTKKDGKNKDIIDISVEKSVDRIKAAEVYTSGAAGVIASLPPFASEAIREAVPYFAGMIKGYDDDDAVVTAVETRSSSPVRILRGDEGFAEKQDGNDPIIGLYPAGEGAGYAGGITSAACDGLRAAERIMGRFAPSE